jgi:hypothetical protein
MIIILSSLFLFFITEQTRLVFPQKFRELINTCSSIYPGDVMDVSIGCGVINNWDVSYG